MNMKIIETSAPAHTHIVDAIIKALHSSITLILYGMHYTQSHSDRIVVYSEQSIYYSTVYKAVVSYIVYGTSIVPKMAYRPY